MRHLKRIVPSTLYIRRVIFTLLGLAFVTAPAIGLIYAMAGETKFEGTIGAVIGMSIIGILITVMMLFLGGVTNKLFEDSGRIIFTAFFMISFQKRKRLYHSTMGEFELIIDEDELEGLLVKQGIFSCKEICKFDLDKYSLMENIKKYLDTIYKDEIAKEKESKRKKELVEGLMKKEGYLDVEGKRDDKITKLGI
jgi:hypothetical protein